MTKPCGFNVLTLGFGVDCGVYHWHLSKNNRAKKNQARHYWQTGSKKRRLKQNTTPLSRLSLRSYKLSNC